MTDVNRLKQLQYRDSRGRIHKLNDEYMKSPGIFCNPSGKIDPIRVRYIFILAGILPPQDDTRDSYFDSIERNIHLLNSYLMHALVSNVGGPQSQFEEPRQRTDRLFVQSPYRTTTETFLDTSGPQAPIKKISKKKAENSTANKQDKKPK